MRRATLIIPILVAALVAFAASFIWYNVLFGGLWLELAGVTDTTTTPIQIVAQFARNLVVAAVLASVIAKTRAENPVAALALGFWLWLGFQAMAIAGSVIHEGYPPALFAIHAGDALLTTLLMTLVIALWPKRAPAVA